MRSGRASPSVPSGTELAGSGGARFGTRIRQGPRPDLTLTKPRSGRTASLRALLANLRAVGIRPHRGEEHEDDAFIRALSSRWSTSLTEGRADGEADIRSGGRRSNRWIGFDRARAPFEDKPGTAAEYGTYADVHRDVWEIGAGWFRESESWDLQWNDIFPATEIPAPSDLLLRLTEHDFAALANFNAYLLDAILGQFRFLPILFAPGGGSGLNASMHDGNYDDVITDPSTCDAPETEGCRTEAPEGITWQEVLDGKPEHQPAAVMVPSVMGWNEWYWDHGREGGARRERERTYQRMALNVYNPSSESGYMVECAMRKCIGVAAFGEGLGIFLNRWAEALAAIEFDLLDYVPFLECGAEYDILMNDVDLRDLQEPPVAFLDSAHEYARLHLVLAGAVRASWREARFKAAELGAWGKDGDRLVRPAWMAQALAVSLPADVELLNSTQTGWAAVESDDAASPDDSRSFRSWAADNPEAADWVRLCDEAGVVFPPRGWRLRAADVVHCAGFHWFHWWTRNVSDASTGESGYQNETDMVERTLAPFQSRFLDVFRANVGSSLAWAVGNIGFPSGTVDTAELQNPEASPPFQAGILVRVLLTVIGSGADHALWYSHMSSFDGGSGQYSLMGLRNDEGPSGGRDFTARRNAWPRVAWFAFQRLSGLLNAASRVEVVFNFRGLVVVRLTGAGRGFSLDATPGPGASRAGRFQFAYVFWLDSVNETPGGGPSTGTDAATVTLGLAAKGDYARLPLVPVQRAGSAAGNPYAVTTEPLDWGDGDPDDRYSFGHAIQVTGVVDDRLSILLLRTMRSPRLGPASSEGFGGAATLGHRAVPALGDWGNIGIVAWFTNSEEWDADRPVTT